MYIVVVMLRFCCRLGNDVWSQLARKYIATGLEGGLQIHVVGFGILQLTEESPWWPVHAAFRAPPPAPFVNVVLGPLDILSRFWTAGVPNVALTDPTQFYGVPNIVTQQYDEIRSVVTADSNYLPATAEALRQLPERWLK